MWPLVPLFVFSGQAVGSAGLELVRDDRARAPNKKGRCSTDPAQVLCPRPLPPFRRQVYRRELHVWQAPRCTRSMFISAAWANRASLVMASSPNPTALTRQSTCCALSRRHHVIGIGEVGKLPGNGDRAVPLGAAGSAVARARSIVFQMNASSIWLPSASMRCATAVWRLDHAATAVGTSEWPDRASTRSAAFERPLNTPAPFVGWTTTPASPQRPILPLPYPGRARCPSSASPLRSSCHACPVPGSCRRGSIRRPCTRPR